MHSYILSGFSYKHTYLPTLKLIHTLRKKKDRNKKNLHVKRTKHVKYACVFDALGLYLSTFIFFELFSSLRFWFDPLYKMQFIAWEMQPVESGKYNFSLSWRNNNYAQYISEISVSVSITDSTGNWIPASNPLLMTLLHKKYLVFIITSCCW